MATVEGSGMSATENGVINEIRTVEAFARALDEIYNSAVSGEALYQVMSAVGDCAQAAVNGIKGLSEGSGLISQLRDIVGAHPISRLVHQCPFTRHSVQKPRGYAGDAELIDYIYGHPDRREAVSRSSSIGRSIMLHNIDRPAPLAVRARRYIVADKLTDIARRVEGARILSVACGHARELELVDPSLLERLETVIGFDQDARSLAVAEGYHIGHGHVVPHRGSIVDLLKDKSLTGFDFVYAAGLYDYLSDKLARRLTSNLFSRLNSGGRLLVANFLPGIKDIGYMEIFMHWSLIYRDRDQIHNFASEIDQKEVARCQYFMEGNQNVGFLEITKT